MLYLHIPYCHRKCSYCGFYSVVTSSGRKEYVDAMCRELESRGDGRALKTIYFGGGTPSILSSSELSRIIDTIKARFDITQLEEVTIEANPEDLTLDWLKALSELRFFDRLSIGIQSFDDRDLRVINRRHDSIQSILALENATKAGFDNVSIDLIMGLPGQDSFGFERNLRYLEKMLPLGCIKHLSCYELTVEPDTILDRQIKMGRLQLPEDDVLAEEYELLKKWCSENGFEQYEVSNYSLPGFRSRHNSRYWNRTPYIGVGAGAHSFDGLCRRWNLSDVDLYSKSEVAPFEEETLTAEDAFNEYVMTSLRTVEGIEKHTIESLVPAKNRGKVEDALAQMVTTGLLKDCGTHYRPTSEGLLYADGMAERLFIV